MTEASTGPKGKKSAKAGRNKAGCVAYKANNSAALRKAKRIAKHLMHCCNTDKVAADALKRICLGDSRAAKALGVISPPLPPVPASKRLAYHAKRAAKARRQYAKAHEAIVRADFDKDTKASASALASASKAQRYLNHYAR